MSLKRKVLRRSEEQKVSTEENKPFDQLIIDVMEEIKDIKPKEIDIEEDDKDQISSFDYHNFVKEMKEILIDEMIKLSRKIKATSNHLHILNGYNSAIIMYNKLKKKKRKTKKTNDLLNQLLSLKDYAYKELKKYTESLMKKK